MSYKEWKTTYQSKASDEQLRRLEETKAGHAKHSPAPAVPAPAPATTPQAPTAPTTTPATPSGNGMSDVCCVPADELMATGGADGACPLPQQASLPVVVQPQAPVAIRLGVLTISDRAANGTYADLSGPQIVSSMEGFAASASGSRWQLTIACKAVVPDEAAQITAALQAWTAPADPSDPSAKPCNLILTTGGTGLSPRDVTPEVTSALLERHCPGICELLLREAVKHEPLAALSRSCAGVRGRTLIVNLPGRPKAVRENLAVLMPLLGHALLEVS